jgi:uncharacterized membrane protein
MNDKWIGLSLGLTTFLSGLYGGIGFFTLMGGNPALEKLSPRGFAEYWQQIDSFMGARMPVFGPVLLLSVLLSAMLLLKEWRTLPFWLMLSAFLVLVGDVAFTLSVNHPLNRLIQGWDLNSLPDNVEQIRLKVVKAFNVRLFLMLGAFALVIFAVWTRNKK